MKHFRIIIGIIIAALVVGNFAGCSGANSSTTEQSGSTTSSQAAAPSGNSSEAAVESQSPSGGAQPIQIITAADELPIVEYAADLYKEKYGADVEIVSQSYDQTYTKIMTSIMGGAPVDIISCDAIWTAEFYKSGVLDPLNDYLTEELKSDILPAFLDNMSTEGKIMSIPFTAQAKWLFYNKAMLKQAGYDNPPATWDELFEMGQTIKDKGLCKYTIAWAATQAEGLVCDWGVSLHASGASWKNDAGTWAFNDENGVKGLSLIVDSIKNRTADPASVSYNDRDNLNPFMAGDIPFVLNWNFAYALSNSEAESKIAGDVGIALIPSNTPGLTSASVTGGGGFGISNTSKNKESAWKYLELIVSREAQEYGIVQYSNMPVLDSMYKDDALMSEYPHMKEMYPQLAYAIPRPSLNKYSEWSNAMQVKLHEAVSGTKSVTDALNEMQAESAEKYS